MKYTNDTNMKNYFEEIGAWPHPRGVAAAYVFGFLLSLMLTLIAYALVAGGSLPYATLVAAIIVAAILQFVVQVYCFLHVGGKGSGDRLVSLAYATLIVFILVAGSLWIMFSLQGRMMPNTAQMEQYMNDQDGF